MLISKKGESASAAGARRYTNICWPLGFQSLSIVFIYTFRFRCLARSGESENMYGPGIADWSKIEVSSNKLQFFTIFLSRKL